MAELDRERYRLLVKISRLYYEEGLHQQEIAGRLGISRPHVSRMLTAAKQEGIVQVTIRNPFSAEQELEQELIRTFGIHDAMIVDVQGEDEQLRLEQLGRTAAVLLESVLKDNDIVGVMAGRTVAAMAQGTDYVARSGLQFVPLVGGWGSAGADWHAGSNAMALADRLKAKYWLLYAPAVVANEETGNLLRSEPEIDKVLRLARRCGVAIVGIGEVSGQATIVRSGQIAEGDLEMLRKQGAVANVCASFLNEQGEEIDFPGRARFIGLTARELRAIPNVIGIAGGRDKVRPILAALRGKWIDILVTDAATARCVLELHRSGGCAD
ncbi:sugar-binding transcriptional regulator [Paenibacillus ginsengarvi]|uniref:Sugar-binding transcriptional regulator n=1 Tax=Paenibacillus ginsengarvi TaxID=400777 RepID=A0A3B0B218_9BACL|nr:sugar-binding transcriptional regulator [Paenibacillus ginsengarvi]RKN66064.1 sugar-binding transcriptional regulator [Paenibacillus ginsengarvi]